MLAHGLVGLAEGVSRHLVEKGVQFDPEVLGQQMADLAWAGLRAVHRALTPPCPNSAEGDDAGHVVAEHARVEEVTPAQVGVVEEPRQQRHEIGALGGEQFVDQQHVARRQQGLELSADISGSDRSEA